MRTIAVKQIASEHDVFRSPPHVAARPTAVATKQRFSLLAEQELRLVPVCDGIRDGNAQSFAVPQPLSSSIVVLRAAALNTLPAEHAVLVDVTVGRIGEAPYAIADFPRVFRSRLLGSVA